MKESYKCDSVIKYYTDYFSSFKIDVKGKAVLLIRADLWYPINFADGEVGAQISYYVKGSDEPIYIENGYTDKEKTIITRPYPNKKIVSICKKIGRKRTNRNGIPIVFDSIEDFFNVTKIEIIWQLHRTNETVIIEYPVTIKKPVQDRIYTLRTYEKPIVSLGDDKSDLEIIDGKLQSRFNHSVYDDYYFFIFHDDYISTIEEMHSNNSTFRIDFDKLDNLPINIVNSMLHNTLQQIYKGVTKKAVYYYRAEVTLNDYTI